jgi:hypothetical protein
MSVLWQLIVGVGIVLGMGVSFVTLYDRFSPIWARPQWMRFGKHRNVARDLEFLVDVLAQVGTWLSSIDSDLTSVIRHDMSKIEWKVRLEALSYIALHSKNSSKRCLALRNLSQVEGEDSMERARSVIQGVIDDPFHDADPDVKRVATTCLQELRRLEKYDPLKEGKKKR